MMRRLVGYSIFFYTCFVLAPVTAFADTVAPKPSGTIFNIPLTTATVLGIVTGLIIPLVSALVSRPKWSETVEGYITLVFAAISGFCVEWANSPNLDHYDWKKALLLSVIALAVAIAGRLGLWKGTALTQTLSTFPKKS